MQMGLTLGRYNVYVTTFGIYLSIIISFQVYLDSDCELHLNMHLVISYLLLFHIDSHVLMVLRRILLIYAIWLLIGFGLFIYDFYYPILVDEPLIRLQLQLFYDYVYVPFMPNYNNKLVAYKFLVYIAPCIATVFIFLLLAPVLGRKQSVAETLHCDGDLRFFGNTFPESLVSMRELRRVPKPSKPWTYEVLVCRNMFARLKNLLKPKFWTLWWWDWVCGINGNNNTSKRSILRYLIIIIWLPISCVLLVLHVLPIFSVWANYLRKYFKSIFMASKDVSIICRVLKGFLLLLQLVGIFILYLMLWNLMVSVKVK